MIEKFISPNEDQAYFNKSVAEKYADLTRKVETKEIEIAPEFLQSAKNIIEMFYLKPKEDFTIVTDAKVMDEFPEMVLALENTTREKMRETKGHLSILVASETTRSALPWEAFIGERLKSRPFLIISALSRSHSLGSRRAMRPEINISEKLRIIRSEGFKNAVGKGLTSITPERLQLLYEAAQNDETLSKLYEKALKKLINQQKSRVISITRGTEKDIFTEGAALENLDDIKERNEKVDNLLKDVEKVHITSQLGTDLWLKIRKGTEINDRGVIDKPGELSNFPVGEWACSPWMEGCDGKLVILNSPLGPGLDRPMITQPITVIFENGKAVSIEGDKPAELLKQKIDLSNADYRAKNPNDLFADAAKVAELGIGTNTKAFRMVDGKKVVAPTSLEGEKSYGTVHIAIGGNGIFLEDPNSAEYNNISFHNDIVLPDVTVECYKKDGTKFNLIENGQPIGY